MEDIRSDDRKVMYSPRQMLIMLETLSMQGVSLEGALSHLHNNYKLLLPIEFTEHAIQNATREAFLVFEQAMHFRRTQISAELRAEYAEVSAQQNDLTAMANKLAEQAALLAKAEAEAAEASKIEKVLASDTWKQFHKLYKLIEPLDSSKSIQHKLSLTLEFEVTADIVPLGALDECDEVLNASDLLDETETYFSVERCQAQLTDGTVTSSADSDEIFALSSSCLSDIQTRLNTNQFEVDLSECSSIFFDACKEDVRLIEQVNEARNLLRTLERDFDVGGSIDIKSLLLASR